MTVRHHHVTRRRGEADECTRLAVSLVPLRIQWPEPPVRTVQHVAQEGRERHREPRGGKGRRKRKRQTAQSVCKGKDPEREEGDAIRRGLDGEAVPAVARGRESGRRMRRWCGVERDGD